MEGKFGYRKKIYNEELALLHKDSMIFSMQLRLCSEI